MKVALISSVFPPAIGGPAKHAFDQAKALKEKGIDTLVITFGANNNESDLKGIRIYHLKKYNLRPRFLSLLVKYLNAYLRIKQVFKRENPDIVHHISGGDYLSLITGIISKKKKIPGVVKFAGDLTWEKTVSNIKHFPRYEDIFSFNLKARLLKRLQRYILNNFDNIIATSSFQMQSLVDNHQISREKLIGLPNFISLTGYEKKRPKEKLGDKVRILNVCRFARWKRIDLCIRIFSMLNHRNLELKIVGGGNPLLDRELKALCRDLKIEERVIFVGEVDPTEISRYFMEADIFFSTTIYEPFGIVFLEAMAAGLPIVAPRIGGIPDIVQDGIGFLVEPYDTDAMVQKLELLVKDKILREEMGQRGNERADDFDINKRIDIILNIYCNLLSRHKECSDDLSCPN
jgi:glycosyltransferase involved in cell wall biosynthesis